MNLREISPILKFQSDIIPVTITDLTFNLISPILKFESDIIPITITDLTFNFYFRDTLSKNGRLIMIVG